MQGTEVVSEFTSRYLLRREVSGFMLLSVCEAPSTHWPGP